MSDTEKLAAKVAREWRWLCEEDQERVRRASRRLADALDDLEIDDAPMEDSRG